MPSTSSCEGRHSSGGRAGRRAPGVHFSAARGTVQLGAAAVDFVRTGDNGTPLQKDEPQAAQAPDGAAIYYYLKAEAKEIKLEIIDARGDVVQTFQSESATAGNAAGGRGGRGGIPNTSPLWRQTAAAFSTAAGLHRVSWAPGAGGGRGGGGRGRGGAAVAAQMTGEFTARLSAGGKTMEEKFTVHADPRRESVQGG